MAEPGAAGAAGILERLAETIESRKDADPEVSYVARLHAGGLEAVLRKVGEEAIETVLAAHGGERRAVVRETADLWFHTLVMLSACGLRPGDVLQELERRFGVSGLEEKARRGEDDPPGG